MSDPDAGVADAGVGAARIRRSLALSFAEKYASTAIQFVASMIVARLITPQAFGIFAIAFAIVGFAHVIREMGVNGYLVQRETLEPAHIRAALFATAVVAWSLGFVLIAAGPVVGALYGDDVRRAELVLSLSLFVQPVSSTIFAVLQREMDFAALLRINVAGVTVNALCAVGLSFAGWSYLGLAWASVIGQTATSLVAACYRAERAHYMPSIRGAGEVFRFGSPIMLSSLLHQFSTNIANLITARFVTLDAIGLFGRAQTVTGLFSRLVMEAVQPLVLPVLSAMRRSGQDVTRALQGSLDHIAAAAWPFFAFVGLCAEPIIVVLFGPRWIGAAMLLRLMCIGGVFWIVQPVAQPMLIAMGRTRMVLRVQAINQVIAVAGVLLAAPHGIVAVAAAAIPISALHAVVWLVAVRGAAGLRVGRLALTAARNVAVTLCALIGPITVFWSLTEMAPLPRLLLAAAALAAGWFVGIAVTAHPIGGELRHLLRRAAWRPWRAGEAAGGLGD